MAALTDLKLKVPQIGAVTIPDPNTRMLVQSMKERIEKYSRAFELLQSELDAIRNNVGFDPTAVQVPTTTPASPVTPVTPADDSGEIVEGLVIPDIIKIEPNSNDIEGGYLSEFIPPVVIEDSLENSGFNQAIPPFVLEDALEISNPPSETRLTKAEEVLPAGMMVPYGGSTSPKGWLLCDGSAISRTNYSRLFAAIGTLWGVGDGSTTFNLPNTNNKYIMGGAGVGSTLGNNFLDLTHRHGASDGGGSLVTSSEGSHNHTGNTGATGSTAAGTLGTVINAAPANHTHTISTDGGHTHTITGNTALANSNPATATSVLVDIRPASLVTNWIIKI